MDRLHIFVPSLLDCLVKYLELRGAEAPTTRTKVSFGF
jgi:hypothetical protein